MIIIDMQRKRRYHNLQFTPMKYYQFRNMIRVAELFYRLEYVSYLI
jgi:hypothetical protein